MPQLPGPPPPPPQAELTWPLMVHEKRLNRAEAAELPEASGFGALAALTGKAWLQVARRRIDLTRMALDHRGDQPLAPVCGQCNVDLNDPFVKERVGVWHGGARLKVYQVGDIRQLAASFELQYDIPNVPVKSANWMQWLERHDAYCTLCVRCALEKGFDPPPEEPKIQEAKALRDGDNSDAEEEDDQANQDDEKAD
ncbi:unnamed protein product, partial [Polarella glacialis]